MCRSHLRHSEPLERLGGICQFYIVFSSSTECKQTNLFAWQDMCRPINPKAGRDSGVLAHFPVPNNNKEADAFGNMHKSADLASGCQVLLHKNLTSFLYRPMFC